MMVSPYLLRPLREYEEVALRDGQPDVLFQNDPLERGLHEQIAAGHFWRDRTREVVAGMKHRWSDLDNLDWVRWFKDCDWLREARRAHSKAILNREAYKQAINERDIQRAMFRGEEN